MRYYIGLFLLAFSLTGAAQSVPNDRQQDLLTKGHVWLGVSAGSGYTGNVPTTRFITPRISYFLADGWSVTAEGRYLRANSPYNFTFLGAGLSTRYYFVRQKHLALFTQLGAVYGQSKYDRFDPVKYLATMNGVRNSNWQTSAGLGVQYRVGKRWSVEAVAERSWLQASYLTPAYSRWQASIGINYRLH